MQHKGTKTLNTQRLILRRFKLSDAKPMYNNWANDPEVTKYLTWDAHKAIKVTRSLIFTFVLGYLKNTTYNWAIVLKSNNQPIGSISVVKINARIKEFEIGYCIGKKFWGLGIVAEALKGVIAFLFDEVGANRIIAKHDVRNPNSGKVMIKAGMVYEASQVALATDKGFADCMVYSVIKNSGRLTDNKPDYEIRAFSTEYKDDLLFCYLSARQALGLPPRIRDDLFDIQKNYFDNGDMFWVAIDSANRVIGMVGTKTVSDQDLWLKRFFIKPEFKREGIGSALLIKVENYAAQKGIRTIHTRFNNSFTDAAKFYPARGFVETEPSEGLRHFIKKL